MIISVINRSGGRIPDMEVHRVLRAVNRQIADDFTPYWSLGATLRLEGSSPGRPRREHLEDMRGDAVLYLCDKLDVDDALGYHDLNHRGVPYGFVFTELSERLGEDWSVTLSHEAIELIGDPDVNLLVMGPHPRERGRTVFHWYELCDAVQAETYDVDGVAVSNFLLPLYFTGGDEIGGRNDFLGRVHADGPLRSFGVAPGGYVGFFDPKTRDMGTVEADAEAARRQVEKSRAGLARRGIRYARFRTDEAGRARPPRGRPAPAPAPAAARRAR